MPSVNHQPITAMDINTILSNCMVVPHPESGEFHIVYETDVKHPHFMERIQGIKKPVYWTTPAVLALLKRARDEA